MHRKSVAAVLVATLVALSLPFSLAVAASAFAQEPEPPTGGPQEPEPQPEPEPEPQEPGTPEEPAPEPPSGPGVESGGELPRTGWDAALYFAIGIVLLLAGARLRVITRIREVVQRVRRRSTQTALREALEPIRAARLNPPEPEPDPEPLHVEPSTPTARRRAGVL